VSEDVQHDVAWEPVMVSVVIACHNAERHLATQLEALVGQECPWPWEVVLSDNGSTDRTVAIAETFRERLPSLSIVDSSAKRGAAAARNCGVRAARGQWILFCDADDEVAPEWLSSMAKGLSNDHFVAACLDHERLNAPWSRSVRHLHTELFQTNPPFLPYTYAAALGVHRSAHDLVGGFDESLWLACEDRDYCYRLQLAGVPLNLVPEALVFYRHRDTGRGIYRQARAYAVGNVRMYRDYRHLGLQRPSVKRAVISWLLTPVKFVLALTSRRRYARFAARMGWRVGRLQGSIRYRIWAP
jgi:glycosyltransferase involved in cell wall biosynthesis